jgi:hypothetical protein
VQVSNVTEKLYALLTGDAVSYHDSPFGVNAREGYARTFCLWAAAVPAEHPGVSERLLNVLTIVAQDIPYFSLGEGRTYESDEFGRYYLAELARPLPSEKLIAQRLKGLSVESQVNILKLPYAIGPVQRIVLTALEDRAGRTFDGDIWKFVQWASSPSGLRWRFDLDAPAEPFRKVAGSRQDLLASHN